MKRPFYALGIIAAVVLIVWAGYALRYKSPGAAQEAGGDGAFPAGTRGGTSGGGAGVGGVPAEQKSGESAIASFATNFRKITDGGTIAFRALSDGSVLVVQSDGQMKKIVEGKTEAISAAPVPNVAEASFSADGTKALVMTATDDGARASVFDIASRTWSILPADVRMPSWSPVGRTLLYTTSANGRTNVVSLDGGSAKARPQVLLSLAAEDLVPQWAASDKIAIAEPPSAKAAAAAWLFDLKKKTLTSLSDGEAGIEVAWNASGTRALVFAARQNGRGGSLSLRDGLWQERTQLAFLSLAKKCAFGAASSTEYLFCGIPRDAHALATAELPDAYLTRALFTIDNLYRIDLSTGELRLLRGEAGERFDVADIATAKNTLYFRDRFTDALYALSL